MKTGYCSFPMVLLLVGLLLASSLFLLIPKPQAAPSDLLPEVQASLERYQAFLELFNRDGKYASRCRLESDRLTFIDPQGVETTYQFAEGRLTRQEAGKTPLPLLDNLGSVKFSQGQLIPDLVSVFILPANNQLPPFFTSVAPRGNQ